MISAPVNRPGIPAAMASLRREPMVSSPGHFSPGLLAEPGVNLSIYPAPIIRSLRSRLGVLPVGEHPGVEGGGSAQGVSGPHPLAAVPLALSHDPPDQVIVEKLSAGGQVEVPGFGQLEVPIPRSSCRRGKRGREHDAVGRVGAAVQG